MSITIHDVVNKVKELARKNPRRVYTPRGVTPKDMACVGGCAYNLTRNPKTHRKDRCIIGQALFELGVPDETLKKYTKNVDFDILTDAGVLFDKSPSFNDSAIHFLQSIQTQQDQCTPWGRAVKGAA